MKTVERLQTDATLGSADQPRGSPAKGGVGSGKAYEAELATRLAASEESVRARDRALASLSSEHARVCAEVEDLASQVRHSLARALSLTCRNITTTRARVILLKPHLHGAA